MDMGTMRAFVASPEPIKENAKLRKQFWWQNRPPQKVRGHCSASIGSRRQSLLLLTLTVAAGHDNLVIVRVIHLVLLLRLLLLILPTLFIPC